MKWSATLFRYPHIESTEGSHKLMAIKKEVVKLLFLLPDMKQAAESGGDEGGRTPYLLNAIQALYQLSYTPKAIIF